MWRWTVSPEAAPDEAEYLDLEYEQGDIVALNGVRMSPAAVLTELNRLGGKHGIGRLDLVENRYVGMKSRGCYETPGGTIMLKGHRAIESITLDREVAHLKDDLMPRYASMIYNGYWWAPERVALQTLIDHTQQTVNGWVRVKLYKGNVIVVVARFEDRLAVRHEHRHLRRRRRRLQPGRRRRLHQAQRAAHAHRRGGARQARPVSRPGLRHARPGPPSGGLFVFAPKKPRSAGESSRRHRQNVTLRRSIPHPENPCLKT